MSEESCIVCLDKYEGSKEEHLKECRRFPVIVTTDVPPKDKETSRLYLMDMDHIEFSYCDCILYDRNGNPNCRIHQGRLQEFYDKSEVVYRSLRGVNTDVIYHLSKNNRPYCNTKTVEGQTWLKTEEYITCKNCLNCERKDRGRIIEAHKLLDEKSYFYKAEEFKAKGEIKDLQ